jgi:hypothetical protein
MRRAKIAPPQYLVKEAYAIRKKGNKIWVLGVDETEAMYGGLDVANALSLKHPEWLDNKDQQPLHKTYTILNKTDVRFLFHSDLKTEIFKWLYRSTGTMGVTHPEFYTCGFYI